MLDGSTAFILQGEKGSAGKNGAPGFIVSSSVFSLEIKMSPEVR